MLEYSDSRAADSRGSLNPETQTPDPETQNPKPATRINPKTNTTMYTPQSLRRGNAFQGHCSRNLAGTCSWDLPS